ncbi:MAG: hypothetical protein U0795_23340 [Pirellulales bacterium]
MAGIIGLGRNNADKGSVESILHVLWRSTDYEAKCSLVPAMRPGMHDESGASDPLESGPIAKEARKQLTGLCCLNVQDSTIG